MIDKIDPIINQFYQFYYRMTIKIETILLEDVQNNDRIKFNTNNHWDPETGRPEDYDQVIGQGKTKNWIDLFHSDYKTMTLERRDIRWIYEAFKIGQFTGKFPHSYDEELEEFMEKHQDLEKELFSRGQEYFVRSERVSLKCGVHGTGPYKSLKEIIESIASTRSAHQCLQQDDQTCQLYLMNWIDDFMAADDLEFRVFVHHNRITAISQQHLYHVNDYLASLSISEVDQIVTKIITEFEENLKEKLKDFDSYVMDFALLGRHQRPYFIEINSFGKEYASGSSLFGWLQDEQILYGSGEDVIFRYVNE